MSAAPAASSAPLFAFAAPPASGPALSVVLPMHDEAGNAGALVREVAAALGEGLSGLAFEIVAVDDASNDATHAELLAAKADLPSLRVLRHAENAGQSRAVRTGVLAARAPVVATLDGDGQNPPADIPALYRALTRPDAPALLAMIGGERQGRQDTRRKRAASRAANAVRRRVLRDEAADTGCGLKVFRRGAFLRLPYFDHCHRYLPALMRREGFETEFLPVSHRPRTAGRSKYTNLGRGAVAVRDLMGLTWLLSRSRTPGRIDEA